VGAQAYTQRLYLMIQRGEIRSSLAKSYTGYSCNGIPVPSRFVYIYCDSGENGGKGERSQKSGDRSQETEVRSQIERESQGLKDQRWWVASYQLFVVRM